LKLVVGERVVVIPDVVVDEVRQGMTADRYYLRAILDADWIEPRNLITDDELRWFGEFSTLLVGRNGRNRGEAAVLAYAKANGATAVVDDMAGRNAAQRESVGLTGTLGLLCEAGKAGLMSKKLISGIADELIAGKYRLPFGPGEFVVWATRNDLLP